MRVWDRGYLNPPESYCRVFPGDPRQASLTNPCKRCKKPPARAAAGSCGDVHSSPVTPSAAKPDVTAIRMIQTRTRLRRFFSSRPPVATGSWRVVSSRSRAFLGSWRIGPSNRDYQSSNKVVAGVVAGDLPKSEAKQQDSALGNLEGNYVAPDFAGDRGTCSPTYRTVPLDGKVASSLSSLPSAGAPAPGPNSVTRLQRACMPAYHHQQPRLDGLLLVKDFMQGVDVWCFGFLGPGERAGGVVAGRYFLKWRHDG
ncbi:hypothetical protein THAOC_28443 [Thalassiosira oceanica]|uniref:Uncharacterized protein n=1 Tax=Thalassiosira oceanica TaxID=159749 RepID=K0RGD1_THAOC|nr:hypothetical protein THAOC_28443 [Thalassiosira oceanica]|eukprot:EJK52300.1 hypothetical protein THAOC_28443 [Thalassiosira oceanica]